MCTVLSVATTAFELNRKYEDFIGDNDDKFHLGDSIIGGFLELNPDDINITSNFSESEYDVITAMKAYVDNDYYLSKMSDLSDYCKDKISDLMLDIIAGEHDDIGVVEYLILSFKKC